MDAECAVCSWRARMIHRLERTGTVRICPIQTPLSNALLRHYGLVPTDLFSWLFTDGGAAHRDFEALVHAARRFGGWGRLATVLLILPGSRCGRARCTTRSPPARGADPLAALAAAGLHRAGVRG